LATVRRTSRVIDSAKYRGFDGGTVEEENPITGVRQALDLVACRGVFDVVVALDEHDGPIDVDEIAASSTNPRAVLLAALRRLAAEGQVVRCGGGSLDDDTADQAQYTLTDRGDLLARGLRGLVGWDARVQTTRRMSEHHTSN
jgi:DNA-binding HxlR family transcriptional regulator